MSNHMYQVIQGKNCAVIHEYAFGVLTRGYAFSADELAAHARRVSPHAFQLATVRTTDADVCRASQVPTVKPSRFITQRNKGNGYDATTGN